VQTGAGVSLARAFRICSNHHGSLRRAVVVFAIEWSGGGRIVRSIRGAFIAASVTFKLGLPRSLTDQWRGAATGCSLAAERVHAAGRRDHAQRVGDGRARTVSAPSRHPACAANVD